ncbi:MAG TPA: alpha/beta fold hydrolase [Flavobacteriales bacterium]|nr:alpha/beta fold hydrolase [Flavobacteriales bacterium]
MDTFTHGRITMAVRLYGHGPLPMLAFHGFGRTGSDFVVLAPALAHRCTIHAFDLPFHGQSPAPGGDGPITPEEWAAYIRAYVLHIGASTVGLLGYSLGGRLALVLMEQCPELLANAFLLAPDGLVVSPWYRGMVRHAWGRRLYQRFIQRPRLVHGLVRLLHRTHLLHDRLYRFLMEQTATPAIRQLVYDVWNDMRLLEPDLARVGAQLQAHEIRVHLLLGRHDKVIKPGTGGRLQSEAPAWVRIHLLPTGHRMLTRETGLFMAGLMQGDEAAR